MTASGPTLLSCPLTGSTGGGHGTHQVYIAGVPDHRLKDDDIVHRLKDDDIVEHLAALIEEKAAAIAIEKGKGPDPIP